MSSGSTLDAVVVGSGPNGLAAALTLARAGLSVEVFEGASSPGGGCRTEELTLPGFRHDVCSTIQSMVTISPFFRTCVDVSDAFTLLKPDIALAHPLDDGRVAVVQGTVEDTAASFGADATTYRRLFSPLVDHADAVAASVLAPLRSMPRRSFDDGSIRTQWPAERVAPGEAVLDDRSEGPHRRVVLALDVAARRAGDVGVRALPQRECALRRLAGRRRWQCRSGDCAGEALSERGVPVHVDRPIRQLGDLPRSRATLFDTSAWGLVDVAGERLSARYKAGVARFQRGPGVFKVDWALSGPVPWSAEPCRRAATVHVGGTFAEVAASEKDVAQDRHSDSPFCIVVQASVVDETRAPSGQQTLWAYCHVPNGSDVDMTDRIEAQIERFAPGFRDLILARVTTSTAEGERHNPNYVGGDITGGAGTLRQTLFRPTLRWNNYRTGTPGLYLCSSSTPPGGGVHGMCGYGAASTVLADLKVRPRT